MLDQQTSSVCIIAEMLKRNGYAVEPTQSTPLYQLTSDTMSLLQGQSSNAVDPENMSALAAMVQGEAKLGENTAGGYACHDEHMAAAAEGMASIIRANLQTVRGVVRPMIDEIVAEVNKNLSALSAVAIVTPIVEDHVSGIFFDPMIKEIMKKPSSVVMQDLPGVSFFAVIDLPQVNGLIHTGMTKVDAMIDELVESVGAERLLALYADHFAVNQAGVVVEAASTRDEFMLLLLMARGLSSRIDEYSESKSSHTSIEMVLTDFMEQLKLRIETSLYKFDMAVQNHQLVVSYPDELTIDANKVSKPILVNGEVYRDWLEEGGEPEILYGAMLKDRATGAVTLFENRAAYQAACQKYLAEIEERNETSKDTTIRFSIASAAETYINRVEELPGCKLPKEQAIASIRSAANKMYATNLDNVYIEVKNIVCRTLFADTHVEEVIDHMIRHEGESSEYTPEEQLANSVWDLLARWIVLGQMNIVGAS